MKLTEEHKKLIEKEFVFTASRSSGPGGQNVNKVNTRIELSFNVEDSKYFSDIEKNRMLIKLKNKINSEGTLLLTAQNARSQLENKRIVIEKFYELIERALSVNRKRIKTLPTKASRLKRLESKKIQALKKQSRKPPQL